MMTMEPKGSLHFISIKQNLGQYLQAALPGSAITFFSSAELYRLSILVLSSLHWFVTLDTNQNTLYYCYGASYNRAMSQPILNERSYVSLSMQDKLYTNVYDRCPYSNIL